MMLGTLAGLDRFGGTPARAWLVFAIIVGWCAWPPEASAQPVHSEIHGSAGRDAVLPGEQGQASAGLQRWKVLGRSVESRVIEFCRIGQGDTQVLIVGPLDGDETAAIDLLELLADHLQQFPRRTSGVTVTLVRDPNPDGRLRRSAPNARGVRLDQNFPTRGWHKVPAGATWLSGREPESEPETRTLVDLFADVQPDRVVVLASTRRNAELAYFGPADELAREFAKSGGLRPAKGNVAAQQGSLAVYAGVDRNTPTIALRIPATMRRDQLWVTYKRALLSVIGGQADESDHLPAEVASPSGRNQVPTLLATTKSAGPTDSPPEAAAAASILSADDLQPGGELVPVVRPPAASAVQVPPNGEPSPTTRANRPKGFSPAILYPQKPPAARQSPATAGKDSVPLPVKKVERLPPVDPKSSPAPSPPQPIPLYPATGY